MREHPIEVNKDTEAWSLNGDLFYRKEDKKPFLGAVQAVEQQEKSLIVVGDEGVLDHYCRMLISRIKDNEQFHLEVFLSTSKDGLLKRFNQMLANLSIDEARKPASADTSVHLLVVNDASAVKDEEWTLLIRLIRDFPGANVRVALFVDKSSLSEFENRFEKLGRRVHRWTVHAPTLDEVKKLREIGKLKGYTSEVDKMLLIAGLEAEEKDKTEPLLKEEVIPESLIIQPSINEGAELKEEPVVSTTDEKGDRTLNEKKPGPPFLRRSLLLLLALAASLLLLSQQQPTKIYDWSSTWSVVLDSFLFQRPDTEGGPILESDAVSNETQKIGSTNTLESILIEPNLSESAVLIKLKFSEPTLIDPKVLQSNDNEKLILIFTDTRKNLVQEFEQEVSLLGLQKIEIAEKNNQIQLDIYSKDLMSYSVVSKGNSVDIQLIYSKNEDPESSQDLITEQDPEEDESTTLSSVENEILTNELSASSVTEDDREEDETVSASKIASPVEIILGADDSEFFIQHIVFSERTQAEDFVASYSGLQNALIVPILSGENRFLAVISGPFQSRESADIWAKEFGLPADFWIRSAGLLKRVVAPGD